jgi:hypothetical protein
MGKTPEQIADELSGGGGAGSRASRRRLSFEAVARWRRQREKATAAA